MEIQNLVTQLQSELPFLKRYDDVGVLKFYVLTTLNNLKQSRSDTPELIAFFTKRQFEELSEKLDNERLLEAINIYEIMTS